MAVNVGERISPRLEILIDEVQFLLTDSEDLVKKSSSFFTYNLENPWVMLMTYIHCLEGESLLQIKSEHVIRAFQDIDRFKPLEAPTLLAVYSFFVLELLNRVHEELNKQLEENEVAFETLELIRKIEATRGEVLFYFGAVWTSSVPEPLHWPSAVAALSARTEHALENLKKAEEILSTAHQEASQNQSLQMGKPWDQLALKQGMYLLEDTALRLSIELSR